MTVSPGEGKTCWKDLQGTVRNVLDWECLIISGLFLEEFFIPHQYPFILLLGVDDRPLFLGQGCARPLVHPPPWPQERSRRAYAAPQDRQSSCSPSSRSPEKMLFSPWNPRAAFLIARAGTSSRDDRATLSPTRGRYLPPNQPLLRGLSPCSPRGTQVSVICAQEISDTFY